MKKLKISDNVAYFRTIKIKDKNLITNDFGYFEMLSDEDYEKFIEGELDNNSKLYKSLSKKGFIKSKMNFDALIERYQSKTAFLNYGPSLHIVVPTLRCNHSCLYCHASAGKESEENLDMDTELAKKVVDMIFKTNNDNIAIEFQGGEPLLNWDTTKYIIEYSRKKEKEDKTKKLNLLFVSNLSLMTDEILQCLIDNKVSISSSLDGPKELHNKNRCYLEGDSHAVTTEWLKKATELYIKDPEVSRPGGIITITKFSLPLYKEIVDEYLKIGINSIYCRTLNPYGFAKKTWNTIGYSADEYFDFYKNVLDYILELNLKGEKVRDHLATIFLMKILTEKDPNHSEHRSPCGAGTGQLAYDYNGDVYTCDDGRWFGRHGDYSFRVGNVLKNSHKELINSDVIKSCVIASCLDTNPGCCDCAFKSYCGVCPIYNYSEQGNIFGQMPTNERCKLHKKIISYIFEKLEDKNVKEIFQNWLIM